MAESSRDQGFPYCFVASLKRGKQDKHVFSSDRLVFIVRHQHPFRRPCVVAVPQTIHALARALEASKPFFSFSHSDGIVGVYDLQTFHQLHSSNKGCHVMCVATRDPSENGESSASLVPNFRLVWYFLLVGISSFDSVTRDAEVFSFVFLGATI